MDGRWHERHGTTDPVTLLAVVGRLACTDEGVTGGSAIDIPFHRRRITSRSHCMAIKREVSMLVMKYRVFVPVRTPSVNVSL